MVATRCVDRAAAAGDGPVPSWPLVRFKIVIVTGDTDSETFERLLRSVAEDADAGKPLGVSPGIVKAQVTDNAVAITSLALDLGGNPGLRRDNPLTCRGIT